MSKMTLLTMAVDTRLKNLFHFYLEGQLDADQTKEFFFLVEEPEHLTELNQLIDEEMRRLSSYMIMNTEEKNTILANIYRISAQTEQIQEIKPAPGYSIFTWKKIAVAALLCGFVTLLFLYFNDVNKQKHFTSLDPETQDIIPGSNKAELSFSDGKTIHLSDTKKVLILKSGKISYIDGTVINFISPPPSGMLHLQTPKGGEYQMNLPDGTKVWLNAASSLRFPATFKRLAQRRVTLEGEAYFEVKKNHQPFIVVSGKQEVRVLGTHFNINSYSDEHSIRTTLLEGSINVNTHSESGLTEEIVLEPRQQSQTGNFSGIKVININPEEVIAWKNGYFDFNEESLEDIMKKISRWYNVTVEYQNPELKKRAFTGTISKFRNVSEVLKKLALSKVVHFKVEESRIIVTR